MLIVLNPMGLYTQESRIWFNIINIINISPARSIFL